MIDTIVLTLNKDMFQINDPDRFEPSARWINNDRFSLGGRGYTTSKQNPSSSELKNGIYKPRLTVTKRFIGYGFEVIMKVEFSAPKMIYNNNFDELDDKDYNLLVITLLQKLDAMGVATTAFHLNNALVSTIHYSKNIALTNGMTPFAILKEIQKSNISQRLDFNQTDFRNEGHSIKFRTNSYEITFYDKMKDMQKAKVSEKRAIENDNAIQMSLFAELEAIQREKPLEVFRMEIRLNQRQKIRQVLKSIGLTVEPTLQNLFKKSIAQKVLLFYLDLIEDGYPKSLHSESKSAKDYISGFIIDNPTKKPKDAILSYGFNTALKELTIREIREMFRTTQGNSWYRFLKQLNNYKQSKSALPLLEPIKKAVNEFIPLKTADFPL